MIEAVEKLLPKYLSVDLVAESAAAFSTLYPVRIAIYDLEGNGFFLPPDGSDVSPCPDSISADPGLEALAEKARDTGVSAVGTWEGGTALVAVPISLEEGCVGLLVGFAGPEGRADDVEAKLLPLFEAYAHLLSETLNGRRSSSNLSEELLERYEEISLAYALAEAMDISKPLEQTLDTILETVAATLAADVLFLHVPGYQFDRAFPEEAARPLGWQELVSVLAKRTSKEDSCVAVNSVEKDPALAPLLNGFAHAAAAYVEVDGDPGLVVLLRSSFEARLYMGDIRLLESVARQLSTFLSNLRVAAARRQLFDSVTFGLARLAESRDPETGEHLERVSDYCRFLAEQLARQEKYKEAITPDFIDGIFRSSPLHDIGKVGIPDVILLKPGKLTGEEFEVIKTHAAIGGKTLEDVEARLDWGESTFLTLGREIAYCHHEKWNGAGYPSGIAGERIPLAARIMALADVYDALTSKRCYKERFSHEKSRSIIVEERGQHFDPDVVDVFLVLESEFDHIRKEKAEH